MTARQLARRRPGLVVRPQGTRRKPLTVVTAYPIREGRMFRVVGEGTAGLTVTPDTRFEVCEVQVR